MLELAQLRQSLLQTLENYQRCGLHRIPRSSAETLPPELLAAIEQLRNPDTRPNQTAPLSAPSAGNLVPPPSPSPSAAPVQVAAAPSENRAETRTESELVAAKPWGLPSLELAERQASLDAIISEVKACRKCADIVCFRQQTVFGAGPLQPTVCFMGEAPGADEDKSGQPFVGRAGQLLTKIIEAMKLKREEVFILNALKCRPPQNRTPVPEEIEQCRPYVEAQLDILQPKFIVCLGAVAVRSLLGLNLPVGSLRGRFHQYRQARVVVTYHPSYLLRNESAKKLVWQDMQMLMREMGLNTPGKG